MITDQPGRIFAVFIFAPVLINKGIFYGDVLLILFGVALLIWDLYWLLFAEPKYSSSTESNSSVPPL